MVTGKVKDLGLVMEGMEPVKAPLDVQAEHVQENGARSGGLQHEEPLGAGGHKISATSDTCHDDKREPLESETILQTPQTLLGLGIQYCPDMGSIVLPS